MTNNTYIRIPNPGALPKEPWYMKVLGKLLPASNPDFEDFYQKVQFWVLEVGLVDGAPLREVGFDSDGLPIVAGPIGRNRGLWVDSHTKIILLGKETVSPDYFVDAWRKIQNQFYYKHRPANYRTREKWIRECRRLCSLTKKLCTSEGDFIENVQRMAAYGYNMREQKNEAFRFFFHLCKETSNLPAGKARQYWDKDALLLKDEEIREIEAYYHGETIKYSTQIYAKYAKILHENSSMRERNSDIPSDC